MNVPPTLRKLLADLLTTYFRYVLVAVIVVAATIGYLVLIKAQFESVRLVGILAFQNENERLRDRQTYLSKVTTMVEHYRQVKAAQAVQSQRILPLEPDRGNLFLTLQALARQAQMQLDSVAISKGTSLVASQSDATVSGRRTPTADARATPTASSGTVQILDVAFSVNGPATYAGFKQLLDSIERSVRIFDLESISFQSTSNAKSSTTAQAAGTTTYTFNLKAYYLEPGTAGT